MIGFANMCQNMYYTKIEFPYFVTHSNKGYDGDK